MRGASLELFEHEKACEAKRVGKNEFSRLELLVTFGAMLKVTNAS